MIQVSSSGWNNLFHYLTNTWQFKQLDSGKTLTSFGVGFRFQSSLFNRLAHVYLEEVAKRMVHVFNQRCHEVYGHLPAPPSKQQQVVANNKDTSNNTPNGKWYHLDIGLNEEGEGLWCCIFRIGGLFRVCIFDRIWAFSLWWVCCELESGVLLQRDRCSAWRKLPVEEVFSEEEHFLQNRFNKTRALVAEKDGEAEPMDRIWRA